MKPEYMAGICGALALAGQAANFVLNLKLRNALLEQERRILKTVAEEYKRSDVCQVEMEALRPREGRSHA